MYGCCGFHGSLVLLRSRVFCLSGMLLTFDQHVRLCGMICSVSDCHKPAVNKRGWCKMHYRRWRVYGDPLGGGTFKGYPLKWLHDHLDYADNNCLIWPFSRNSDGRAQIRTNRKKKLVSRIMCEHRHGPPPTPKHEAAHNCGNGHLGCVNGGHIRWATSKENQSDRLTHGTHNRGGRNGKAKLTEADVIEIRASIIPQKDIAMTFGVDPSTISHIISRKSWEWL